MGLLTGAVAMPGGYTGYGGVYRALNVEAETMNAAKQASKMAIFEDESQWGDAETRKERNNPLYVPTFLTGVLQPEQQFNANTYQQQYSPVQYSPSAQAIY